ncbi:Winged helix-turn-helix DNA-binding domain [Phytophthora cactorum]|nr:Winged helix-turn-helix DNA-binding domain [Phytophthora cactorum]
MCIGRNKPFANSPGAPQASNPTASHTKTSTVMNSMPPFPVCVTAPSTFSVAHPLHCGPAVFRQHQSCPNVIIGTFTTTTPTASPSQLASPTMTYSKTRASPVVSPNKKTRKSRVVFDFSTEEMAEYFHMSQREAAQQLGVATVTIKRNCRRLGIVWPYRLMKSKKNAINWSAISREDAQRIRQERATRSSDTSDDEAVAKVMTMLCHSSSGGVELTEAGHAFARLPLDCMNSSD